ncbi:type III-B CRISPR module RAMP protein Cmr6 [Rhodoferax sp.]|uniref:type III-B CRISPR module RAMP protein Cmr6 n=1 Tax=Rhodoferax sp. TaxID=50421 RepID=UPI002757CF27|nr:type III-B CRISPR module RAMP protein Cmr6 [Rhodoferax sp.]
MPLPQRVAATPDFIPHDLRDAAPGHRYQLYLQHWQGQNGTAFAPYKKATAQGKDEKAEHARQSNAVLKDLCPLPVSSVKVMRGIQARQQAAIGQYGEYGHSISAISTAPFATGLGNEHPIENGFAFLTPYGLPYLAGSGVKGILRRAMQELRDDHKAGFTNEAIDALFGPEDVNIPEDAKRGALDFWDVFPKPFGDKLVVEIMTPHFGSYYQGKATPHDSGAPIPVSFLAVPAKSDFDFHVVCHPTRLPESLQNTWRDLLQDAFDHAFAWVGFGAKTSVGYGAMKAAAPVPSLPAPVAPGSSIFNVPPAIGGARTGGSQTWPAATLKLNPGKGEITASFEGKTTAPIKGTDAEKFLTALGDELAGKLKKRQELKGVSVEVEQQGNAFTLKGMAAT